GGVTVTSRIFIPASVVIVVVPIMPLLARSPALEVRRIVGAPGAGVDSQLGIDAQRTRTVHHPCRGMRCDDAMGRLALLDAILRRRQHVEGIRAGSARAMLHTGH